MSHSNSKKRASYDRSEKYVKPPKIPNNSQKNAINQKYKFPSLPKKFLAIKKYSIEEKNLLSEDHVNMHHIIETHYDFWIEIFELKAKCEDYIMQRNAKTKYVTKSCYIISIITKLQKKYLFIYQEFRRTNGEFIGSVNAIKCCAGHAHGWTFINRLFMLEAMIFNFLYYDTKKKYFKSFQLTSKEIESLIHKDVGLLILNTKPVHLWSAKMIQLQCKLISQKWNHIKGLTNNSTLQTALRKLFTLIQMRLYLLIENGMVNVDLQKPYEGAQEGIMSENFKGKIICTPQNNCGMSSVTSKDSWLTNLIITLSKLLTKLQNTLYLISLIAPKDRLINFETKLNQKGDSNVKIQFKVSNFNEIIQDEVEQMLDNNQLQKMLISSLCPSIIGIDVLTRASDVYGGATQADYDLWSKARNVAPTGVNIWLDEYLQDQKKEYILESSLKSILYDLKDLCVFNTFDLLSKRDGRNDMGFLRKFVIRIEELQTKYDLVFKDMHEYDIPLIIKVGADYIVMISKKRLFFHCGSSVTAIVLWAELLKKVNNWKIKDIDFKVIYKNLFKNNLISKSASSS